MKLSLNTWKMHSDLDRDIQAKQASQPQESLAQQVGSFVINLDRSPERMVHMKALLEALPWGFYRVAAVDGKTLSKDTIRAKVDLKRFQAHRARLPKIGEIGCALSHHKALEAFLATGLMVGLILEDDVAFDPATLQMVIKKAVKNIELWDVVGLQLHHRGLPKTITALGDQGQRLVRYRGHILEAGAYLVTRSAAEAYLKHFFPIELPYDYFYTREWALGIRFRGIEPRLVQQVLPNSTIQQTEKTDEVSFSSWVRAKNFTSKYWFNFRTDVTRFLWSTFKP